jgi:hypothetical protein
MTRALNHVAVLAVFILAVAVPSPAGAQVTAHGAAHDARYRPLPATGDSWYWEIDPPRPGLAGLPPTSASYPAPGSARIWDTDLFNDSNTSTADRLGIPTGESPVVRALHAAGHYTVCYVEAGAFQSGFPDDANFAAADYGDRAPRYEMRGYANEWWFNLAGFRHYVAGEPSTLRGSAKNIAAGLNHRFRWCVLEGQDAVEPDDIDGYTNKSATGVAGGGWHLTQADSAGFERWLAYQAHADGLAILEKNDPANAEVDAPLFDGALSEECNYYKDPCAGRGGDWDAYLTRGKPVFDAEYVQDGETARKFCAIDEHFKIWGALFSVDLNGAATYRVCWNAGDKL